MPSLDWSLRLRFILRLERYALPLWRWVLRRRLVSGKETPHSLDQKLMLHLPASEHMLPQGTPLIWGHAVGVGEVLALLGLFRRIAEYLPDHHFLLTSSSRTSGDAIAKQNLPESFHHQFAPVDHPGVMRRFLDVWQPKLACWSEADLWPGMVKAAHQRGIPLLMFNVRLDAVKARRLNRLSWFYKPLLSSFTRLYAQNAVSAQHMSDLGVAGRLASVVGNIKSLAPALRVDSDQLAAYHLAWRDRPCWLLASSHAGEEEIAIKAHRALLAQSPRALLLIAPRDAFRGAQVARLADAQGMRAALRSRQDTVEASHSVYVVDTMGELGLWYALCPVALVGGSLVPVGGHNPYEALAAGCRVLSGPQVHNFSESYKELIASDQARTVNSADDIARDVAHAWVVSSKQPVPGPISIPSPEGEASALLQDILQTLRESSQA